MRHAEWKLCSLATLLLACTAPGWATTYTFQAYNNPGDPNFNQLLGINNGGTIAGYFGDGTVVPNNGYVLSPPSTYTAENFPGAVQTQVVGINNAGLTVGFFIDSKGNNVGFFKNGNQEEGVIDPNTPVVAGSPITDQLLGVNNLGIAAGFYVGADGYAHGYTFNTHTGVFTPVVLPNSFLATDVTVTGIDDAGVITGFYTGADGLSHGYIDNNGTFTRVDDPFGLGGTMLLGLNNTGEAVGSFVDFLGANEGVVYNLQTGIFTSVVDPNESIQPTFGVEGTTVNGINDQGDLVGFYSDSANVDGFEATSVSPTPEPSTLVLLGSGLLGMGGLVRRRYQGA